MRRCWTELLRYMNDRAWIEIDLRNLEHNVKVLKYAMPPGCRMMAVVKADAYGHGAESIATYLEKLGVDAFAVATVDEGIDLRKVGVSSEILILGYTDPCRAEDICKYELIQALVGYDHAVEFARQEYPIKAHIKIDTGMHRLGFDYADIDDIAACFSMPELEIGGIFSHLCVADSADTSDVAFTQLQIQRFYGLLEELTSRGISIPKIHIQSSYGLLNYPELKCDYVRVGIALYGVHSTPNARTMLDLGLRPVLSLKSRIAQIRQISTGETVGYGRSFVAQRDSKIAVVPIGYADGIPRYLSNGRGHALIAGQRVPIVGRLCMDQLSVDVTNIPDVRIGTVVTFIGSCGDQTITSETVADKANTITNELLSRIGRRLPKINVIGL